MNAPEQQTQSHPKSGSGRNCNSPGINNIAHPLVLQIRGPRTFAVRGHATVR